MELRALEEWGLGIQPNPVQSRQKHPDINDEPVENLTEYSWSEYSEISSQTDASNLGHYNGLNEGPGNFAAQSLFKFRSRRRHVCIYCKQSFVKLGDHLIAKHKDKDKVRQLTALKNENNEEYLKFLSSLRQAGAETEVITKIKESNGDCVIQTERGTANVSEVSKCKGCRKYLKKTSFYKHKCADKCRESIDFRFIGLDWYENDLQNHIFNKLRKDDVGDLVRKDPLFKKLAQSLFRRVKGSTHRLQELAGSIRSKLRLIAKVFISFKVLRNSDETTASQMFECANVELLEQAIIDSSRGSDNEVKHSLRLSIGSAFKSSIESLLQMSCYQNLGDEINRLNKIEAAFKDVWKRSIATSEDHLKCTSLTALPKPCSGNKDADIDAFHTYCKSKLLEFSLNGVSSKQYYKNIRQFACARLSVFNGVRGGECCRLTVAEAVKGLISEWYEPRDITTNDDIRFAERVKIMMVMGKTTNTQVYVPQDCLEAIKVLIDSEIRSICGINDDNVYVFTFGKGHDSHVKSYMEIATVCKLGNINQVGLTKPWHKQLSIDVEDDNDCASPS